MDLYTKWEKSRGTREDKGKKFRFTCVREKERMNLTQLMAGNSLIFYRKGDGIVRCPREPGVLEDGPRRNPSLWIIAQQRADEGAG